MNGSQQTVAAGEPCSGKVPWRRVVGILAAAIALGLVYNVASPLGVRAPKPTAPAASAAAQPFVHAARTNATAATNVTVAPSPATALSPNEPASAFRWGEVKPLLESGQIVLVDARAKAAYDIEHIPGALSLPAEGAPEEFIAFAMKHPKDTAIVVYCGGDNCDLSHELAEKLRKDLGYTNVKEMPGGIVEYRVSEGKSNPTGPQ